MTKLNTNCTNDEHFKYLVKMRTIRNKHYKNKDHFTHLIKMKTIRNKHYENENEKSI